MGNKRALAGCHQQLEPNSALIMFQLWVFLVEKLQHKGHTLQHVAVLGTRCAVPTINVFVKSEAAPAWVICNQLYAPS